ncbi:hypothetical protein [Saccharibacillus sp. JS10]|uniref:DUF7408 domain-containing protein n=1 Tax=Saccharibacillus sp. JS10 TaxID=2950552 RepID=UPI00210C2530|nr:hypothetical protein [Saccharibacillus sp. JS10]MCQ4086765.1 hypothetical protein [Saccharibacillus sp. JS10]
MDVIKKGVKIVFAALLAMMILMTVIPTALVQAQVESESDSLQVTTEFGYGGKVNEGRWNPLKVTLTSKRDLEGDLVIQVSPQNGLGESTYVRHVELPAGTAKEVVLAIPGGSYSRNTSLLQFYKGSVEKGKSVPFSEGRAYLSSAIQQGGVMGVLSSDPDTMNFMSLLQSTGSLVKVVPLKAADIGEDPMLLDGLDALVINDFPMDTLNEAQTQAIRSWVQRGGTLVWGGGSTYPKTVGALEDLSPVQASGGTVQSSASTLASADREKKLPANTSLTLTKSEAKPNAQVRYESNGVPIIASMPMQAGEVFYAGYDLSLEPLASWQGSAKLWGELLQSRLQGNAVVNGMFGNVYSNLSYALDYFPSIHLPKLNVLVWMLLIYVVIVAPILYLILRKFDKREWAWIGIPLIAVVSSAAIYMTGSSDKTNELAHTLSYVNMNGEGQGVRSNTTALFVPRSGEYEIDFPQNTSVSMMNSDAFFGMNGEVSRKLSTFVRQEPDNTQLHLGDMSYWSVSKFAFDEAKPVDTGKWTTDLSVDEKGAIVGTVTNDTKRSFTDVALIAGNQLYKLGTLKPAETVTIGKGFTISSTYYDISNLLLTSQTTAEDPYLRQRSMLQNMPESNATMNPNGVENTYLIAFEESADEPFDVDGKSVRNDRLSLYKQPVSLELIKDGEVRIPSGYIGGYVAHTNTTQVSDDGNGRINASPGVMTVAYQLPDLGEVNYEDLEINLPDGRIQTAALELWNQQKKDWEPVDWKTGATNAIYNNAADYVNPDNRIQIRFQIKQWTSLILPQIKLKGAVQP